MAIVDEIKCARCDRKYSGVRSRCPYCGARRIGQGKYSENIDNTKGKMLICILIMAVMVAAVGALLITTPAPEVDMPMIPSTEEPPASPLLSGDDGFTSIPGIPLPSPTPTPEVEIPQQTPQPIDSITITYDGRRRDDITARVGEKVPLAVRIEPPGVEFEGDIEWTSSNPGVFDVVKENTEGTRAVVTGIGVGTATLTVTVRGTEVTCIIRVNAR